MVYAPKSSVTTTPARTLAHASQRPAADWPQAVDDAAAAMAASKLALDSELPVVVLPAYRRRCPDATPLLALWLASEDVRVLIHGDLCGPDGAGTRELLGDLGIEPAISGEEVHAAWRRRRPAFVALARLAPELAARGLTDDAALIQACLVNPVRGARALLLAAARDRASAGQIGEVAGDAGLDLMVIGATPGSAVAPLEFQPRIDTWIDGIWRIELSLTERPLAQADVPVLPNITDWASNAVWVQSVLSGERPAPHALMLQIERIMAAVRTLEGLQRAAAGQASHSHGAQPGAC